VLEQRVLNDLYKLRLSHGRMIWFLAPPATPLSFHKARLATHRKIEKEMQLANKREGGRGVGKEPNNKTTREPRSSINNSMLSVLEQAQILQSINQLILFPSV
jgi:hypothetical protein